MQDRFRYRIWDLSKNKWDNTYNYDHLVLCLVNFEQDFVLEMCVGVKDKHNKLIYEGDIVSWNGVIKTKLIQPAIGEVKYAGSFYYVKQLAVGKYKYYSDKELENIKRKYPKEEHESIVKNNIDYLNFTGIYGNEFIWKELEVIGNIHENTELLT